MALKKKSYCGNGLCSVEYPSGDVLGNETLRNLAAGIMIGLKSFDSRSFGRPLSTEFTLRCPCSC